MLHTIVAGASRGRSIRALGVRLSRMLCHTFKTRVLTASLLLLAATGCVSFRNQHLRWIDMVEFDIAKHKTIEELGFDPRYPSGWYIANEHYFAGKDTRPDGTIIYHYAYKLFHSERMCRYHLEVNPSTKVVVGWGMDQDLAEAKRNCIVSA
jgi:hypothetical protein